MVPWDWAQVIKLVSQHLCHWVILSAPHFLISWLILWGTENWCLDNSQNFWWGIGYLRPLLLTLRSVFWLGSAFFPNHPWRVDTLNFLPSTLSLLAEVFGLLFLCVSYCLVKVETEMNYHIVWEPACLWFRLWKIFFDRFLTLTTHEVWRNFKRKSFWWRLSLAWDDKCSQCFWGTYSFHMYRLKLIVIESP